MDEPKNGADDVAPGLADITPEALPPANALQVAPDESDWSGEAIEEAYQRALAAIGDVPWNPEAVELAGEEDAGTSGPPQDVVRAEQGAVAEPVPASPPSGPGPAGSRSQDALPDQSTLTPAQIIEAVLFVGGDAVSTKKLRS